MSDHGCEDREGLNGLDCVEAGWKGGMVCGPCQKHYGLPEASLGVVVVSAEGITDVFGNDLTPEGDGA